MSRRNPDLEHLTDEEIASLIDTCDVIINDEYSQEEARKRLIVARELMILEQIHRSETPDSE